MTLPKQEKTHTDLGNSFERPPRHVLEGQRTDNRQAGQNLLGGKLVNKVEDSNIWGGGGSVVQSNMDIDADVIAELRQGGRNRGRQVGSRGNPGCPSSWREYYRIVLRPALLKARSNGLSGSQEPRTQVAEMPMVLRMTGISRKDRIKWHHQGKTRWFGHVMRLGVDGAGGDPSRPESRWRGR